MKLPTDNTPTFYNSKEGSIQTFAACDSMASYCPKTTPILWHNGNGEDYLKEKPELKLMPFNKALELSQKADKERYQAGVCKEITEANFHEMVNCLYPANWVNYSTNESFRLSEDLTGELSNFYIRVFDGDFPNHKERFFSVVMPRDTRHNRLIDIASKQFNLEVK
jgi:hypothetical protein